MTCSIQVKLWWHRRLACVGTGKNLRPISFGSRFPRRRSQDGHQAGCSRQGRLLMTGFNFLANSAPVSP